VETLEAASEPRSFSSKARYRLIFSQGVLLPCALCSEELLELSGALDDELLDLRVSPEAEPLLWVRPELSLAAPCSEPAEFRLACDASLDELSPADVPEARSDRADVPLLLLPGSDAEAW
jgi:hypothetical protein